MALVSALVCTRNRPQSLLRTVRSLLRASDDAEFELMVIDQSEGPETKVALASVDDARLLYIRLGAHGKGAALNEGLRRARGQIVVCTDDDCEAPPDWVMQMAAALEEQPKAAVLFCNVSAGPHDPTAGYVPAFERNCDRRMSSVMAARHGLGMGAGMALRREAVLSFGGFDETFGPGARFPSGDDYDISLRSLLFNWEVYEYSKLSIVHHGFRKLIEGREHTLRDWRAIGALCAKPIRAGYPVGILLSIWLFSANALWPPILDILMFRRPAGRMRVVGFVRGFKEGLLTPVDQRTLSFRRTG
jgi:glycosyltransferase involved in cell wall biosynthesis